MNLPPRTGRLAVEIAMLAGIDLVTKRWAVGGLADGPVELPGPVDLQLHYNHGTAFGQFTDVPSLVLAAATIVITVVLLNMWRTAQAPAAPVALIVAGGVANTLDRLEAGSVVDMLHTGWWPTFNLADIYIAIGVVAWVTATIVAPTRMEAHDDATPKAQPTATVD